MQSNQDVKTEKLKVLDFLSESAIALEMSGTNKKGVLEELTQILKTSGKIQNSEGVLNSLLERERLGSTGIGQGIAIPHTKSEEVKEIVASLGVSRKGIPFDALDGEPVHIFFLLVAPQDASGMHLKALARISRLLKDKFFRQALLEAKTPADIAKIIRDEDQY